MNPNDPYSSEPGPSMGPSPTGPAAPSPTAPTPGTDTTPPAEQSDMGMQATPPLPDVHPKKSKKLPLLGAIFGALMVVLIGASALAYYVVMNKPQNVLNLALVYGFSTSKVKSVSFTGGLDVKPKGGEQSFGATFEGEGNNDGAFNISGKVDAIYTNVTFDARSADGKTYYLRVGGLDGIATLLGLGGSDTTQYLTPIISTINNQWLEVNQSMVQQLTGSTDSIGSTLTDADRKEIRNIYKKNQFLVVDKVLKDEKINGKDCHHYKVIVDGPKLKNFLAELKDANISSIQISAATLKEFAKTPDADLKKYPIDTWISKSDKMIRKTAVTIDDNGDKITLYLTVNEYNQPVNVVKPRNAKSLMDVINSLLNGTSLGNNAQTLQGLGAGISL